MAYTLIFLLKKCEQLLHLQKLLTLFNKNTCELGIVFIRTVNIMATNELVKLTKLWTTGPSSYEGESISKQPIPLPMDWDGHDFHALFQYMFYTWVQNCTRIASFFNKILNVKHG